MVKTRNIYIVPIRRKDRKIIISDVRAHNGTLKHAIDFSLPEGTPILAAQDGRVVYVKQSSNKNGGEPYYKYLNSIIIKHENDEYSEYSHLIYKGARVKKGQTVKVGEIIGYSGNTRLSTEPHLHFHVSTKGSIKNLGKTLEIRFKEKLKYEVNSRKRVG